MTALYRNFLTREELDAAYDNTNAVSDSAQILAGFEERSRLLAERCPEELDLRFGPRERQRIDFSGRTPQRAAHGVHPRRILADAAQGDVPVSGRRGAASRNFGGAAGIYAGAGTKSGRDHPGDSGFPALVAGKRRRARVRPNPDRRCRLVGGGHLATMMADEPGVTGILAISGIFDLEPIRLCYLNDKLQLKSEDVASRSPLRLPLPGNRCSRSAVRMNCRSCSARAGISQGIGRQRNFREALSRLPDATISRFSKSLRLPVE